MSQSELAQDKVLRQLETMSQVSRQLTAALDLDELLLKVVELIKSSFNYYHVHVYLLDPESGYLIMREGSGEVGQKLREQGHRIPVGRGFVGRVGQTGQPSLVGDVSQNSQWLPNPLLPDTRSELTVPLKIGERILGVLDVQSNEVNGLTQSDLVLMESLGQQTAVAVQNAVLFRETMAVSIISRAVSSSLGMEQVFAAVSRELKSVVDFDYMTVATYYEIANQIELTGVDDRTNVDIPLEEGVQLPIDQCIPGLAIQQNRSIIVPSLADAQLKTFIDAEILSRHGMCSVLSVPLVAQGQSVGAINLVSRRERTFTAADAHLMEQISGQLAVALTNAMIFESVQQVVGQRTAEIAVFRAMTENASEAIALANVEQIITYANPAFYRMYGYDPANDSLSRRSLTSFIVADEGALSDELRDHILRRQSWQAEMQHRRKDGTRFIGATTVFGVRDDAGEVIAFAAITHDVTAERKIMAISQAASSTPELGQLAPLVLQEIAKDTDIDRIILILYDKVTQDGPQSMSIVAVYDAVKGARRLAEERLMTQQSPFSVLVYFERSPIFVADVETDERLTEKGRALLQEQGMLSMLALPIWVRDKIVGMVGIDWHEHVDLTKEQIALYQTMVNQVSTAVENARLIEQQQHELEQTLDRRVREAATSIEVGQAIGTVPELQELFSRVVTLIKERFGYYHAHVYQIDPAAGDLVMMAGYGEPGRIMKERGHRIPIERGLVGKAATTGKPVRVSDVSKQENWLPNVLLPETRSELAVPIKLGDKVLGVLDVQSDRLDGVAEDDELLLLGLCGQIATSINNTQLVEQLQASQVAAQRRAHQLELSAGVSQELASTLDLEKLLSQVVSLIQEGFDYYHAQVYLADRETGDLILMEGTGEPGLIMKERGHCLKAGQGIPGQAVQAGVTMLASDVSQSKVWLPNPLLPETRAEVAIPLKLGTTVLGVLAVQSNHVNGLNEEDRALLEGLGGQIAVAVQNALNFRDIEAQVEARTHEVRRFQSLAENASDAIIIANLEGRISFANAACYRLYGYDQAKNELLGRPLSDLWPAEAHVLMRQVMGQSLDSGWRGRATQMRGSGQRIAVFLTLFAMRDEQNNPVAMAVLARDMTVDELIEQVSQAVGAATSLSQVGVELLRVVIQGVQVDRGYFVIYEDDGGGKPRLARLLAAYDEKSSDVVAMDVVNNFDAHTIHSYLYSHGKPIICDPEIEHDENMERVCHELEREIFAAFPLIIQNRVGGMLLFDRQAGGPFMDAEISFFSSVVQQVSLITANFILRDAQRRETQRELERRRQETLTTTEVAQAIAAATELGELFKRVVTLVKERFNYYHVHLYEHTSERHELVLVAGYGEPGRIMVERGHRLTVGGRGLNSTAVMTKAPVLVTDVRQDPMWLPNELLPDTRSELAVPIMMGDRVLGVLDVQQDIVSGLTEADQNLLLNLCGQVASAMENTRLLQETQTSLRRTDLLLNLSTALSSLTTPQQVADALTEQLMNISSIERCMVGICSVYDEWGVPQVAEVYALRDRDPAFARAAVMHAQLSLAAYPTTFKQVVTNREVLVISDVATDDRLADEERALFQHEGAVSVAVVPMAAGEHVMGYFVLEDRQPYVFSTADLELYAGIANQSAVAFSNALALTQANEALEDEIRLYQSSRAIATATTLEMLSRALIDQIVTTHIDRCQIMLYEQRGKRQVVSVVGAWAADGDAPSVGTHRRVEECPFCALFGQYGHDRLHVFTDANISDLPEKAQNFFAERSTKALALVPLAAGEEQIGYIAIERHLSSSFNPDALRLYEALANQSAVALRNVQLLQVSQRQLEDLQKSYNEVTRLADTVRQLSSPVIQIWEDVLVLPLVGTIDSQRAMRVMEDLLYGITRFQAEQVIIDVTGVPVMDTAIVNHLMQTIKAATLLGAKCMLVGIDSEKAQTIVALGLDWKGIRTYSNLRAGIQAALRELGFAITMLEPANEE